MAELTRSPTSDEAISGTWDGTAGNRHTVVNDYPDASGSSFLTHGTAAGVLTFGHTAPTVPAGSTDISVEVRYYDQKTASQGCTIGARLKIGGVYFNSGTHNPTSGTWVQRTDTFATNPAGGAWTVESVNAIQAFGWNSGSDANPTIRLSSIQLAVIYTEPPSGPVEETASAALTSAIGAGASISVGGQRAEGRSAGVAAHGSAIIEETLYGE